MATPADDVISLQIARGFGAHGVLPAVVVDLPAALHSAPVDAAPALWALPQPSAAAVYLGPSGPSPQQDAPVLMASLKLMAMVVGLGGAYLAGLFVLGEPEAAQPATVQPPVAIQGVLR